MSSPFQPLNTSWQDQSHTEVPSDQGKQATQNALENWGER